MTRKYIRGSSLLLVGRVIAIVLNLGVQVLTLRYLSKSDYGAFAYALGIASMGSSVILMGLGKSVPRFVPMYHERGDYARTFGTIALAVGTVWILGLSLVGLVVGLRDLVPGGVDDPGRVDPLAMSLLLIIIVLAPLDAFDHLLQKLVAVFATARAIFVRRHLLGPGLKLVAITVVVLSSGGVYLLACGYVAGAVIGVWLYVKILLRVWRERGLLEHLRLRKLTFPVREVFGFSFPLLTSDLGVLMRSSVAVILLGYFHNSSAVAEYRAVLPLAGLNMIVFEAFGFLYDPLASRMLARNEKDNVRDLYWQTAIWITVLTFPIFAVTCSLAEPVTVFLFGEKYARAGSLLALLAVGYYVNAALGFNAATLRVHGKLRQIVVCDLLAATVFLGSSFALIPRYGALGAAIGTMATMVMHNVFNQLALWIGGTGIRLLDRRFMAAYLLATAGILALMAIQWLTNPPLYLSFALAVVASFAVIRLTRPVLNPAQTFPEVLRIPVVGRVLFGGSAVRQPRGAIRVNLGGRGSQPATAKPARGTSTPEAAEDERIRTSSAAAGLADHLCASAYRYFPELSGQPARVRLLRERHRPASTLYEFDLTIGAISHPILVKTFPPRAANEAPAERTSVAGPPRLGPTLDGDRKAEFYYAALSRIHEGFSRVGDPRFGTVRPFDLLPADRAVVMQAVRGPNLREVFSTSGRSTVSSSPVDLTVLFNNAGAWLRLYHGLPAPAHVQARHTRRSEVVVFVEQLATFLRRRLSDDLFFEWVVRTAASNAQKYLPEALPVGLAHGDYAMRNVLVGPGDRVTVIDTVARWNTSIYEDLASFVVGLRTNRPHVLGLDTILRRQRTGPFEQAFLAGYFMDMPVPHGALALYEVQAMLSKWAAILSSPTWPSRAWPAVARSAAEKVMSRFFRRQIGQTLRALDGATSPPSYYEHRL